MPEKELITDEVFDAVTKSVLEVVERMNLEAEGRTGGYLFLLHHPTGRFSGPRLICEVTNGKDDKYKIFSMEKAYRLSALRDFMISVKLEDLSHVTSWQSRSLEKQRYGGAVLTGYRDEERRLIFSFSGLPEECDEAAMLLTAVRLGTLSIEAAIHLAQISKNSVILENEWEVLSRKA